MSFRYDKASSELVIDGFEKGIAPSPYQGISNIRNLNTTYYSGVAYNNYRRRPCTFTESGTWWYAGSHSTDVSDNTGWIFVASPGGAIMSNPIQKAVSPVGLIYILDDSGQIWKQSAVNSTTFNLLGDAGRYGNGASGIVYFNNYIAVFGDGLIEWCGDGSGDAGIISGNWNINASNTQLDHDTFTTSFASIPYAIIPASPLTNGLALFQNGDPVTFSSTVTLPAPLVAGTTYYLVVNSSIRSINRFAVAYRQKDTIQHASAGISSGATSATLITNWDGITRTYAVFFSDGEYRDVVLTNGSASMSWSVGLTNTVSDALQIAIEFTSDGTGTHTITDVARVVPFGNCTSVVLYFSGSSPWTTATFDPGSSVYGSYVDPTGATVTGMWKGATGDYNLVMGNGQKVSVLLVNGSPTVNFAVPLNYTGQGGSWTIELLVPTVTDYRPYNSKVDGNVYFANGPGVGSIQVINANLNYNPAIGFTTGNEPTVSNEFFLLPVAENRDSDYVTDMVDLQSNMIVSGKRDVYTWDYISNSASAPVPVGEYIHRSWNLLNQIYIFAGQKGNLYVSNGNYVQLLLKLPDYIAGVFDPVWTYGGVITHRSRIFFQALAQTTSGTNILAGIFSIITSPQLLGETASGLVMEAQNSYGLAPNPGATGAGLLIDNEPSSDGRDSYYSAWSNGSALGGVDYNDTSLWQNFEPTIETDIIHVGTFLKKGTLGQIQFKLDRPMATGDQIRVYARASLSDSYTLVGTTTTTNIGDAYPSNLAQSQWIQFKVQFKCAASGSSFIPLREIRVQYNPES